MATIDSVKLPDNSTYDLTDNYSGYQTETLATPITVDGTSETTVEGALGAVNDYANKIKGSMSNENLVDNPFFKVNSRGETNYRSNSYTVDRWRNGVSTAIESNTVVVTNDGITINNGTNLEVSFYQRLDATKLIGKTITMSAIINDDLYKLVIDNYDGTTQTLTVSGNIEVKLTVHDGTSNTIQIKSTGANTTLDVKAIKLELGSISTLANDVAPDNALELAKCQTSTVDPSDTYANQGQLMTSALQGVYGAVNKIDADAWLRAVGVSFSSAGNTKTITLDSTNITTYYPVADADTPLTLSVSSFVNSNNENFRIQLLNSSNVVVATLNTSNLTATGVGCKINGDFSNYGTVTISDFMIRDARITDDTFFPYAKTNRELTELADTISYTVSTSSVSAGFNTFNISSFGVGGHNAYVMCITLNYSGNYTSLSSCMLWDTSNKLFISSYIENNNLVFYVDSGITFPTGSTLTFKIRKFTLG